jgi:hypothetical protein
MDLDTKRTPPESTVATLHPTRYMAPHRRLCKLHRIFSHHASKRKSRLRPSEQQPSESSNLTPCTVKVSVRPYILGCNAGQAFYPHVHLGRPSRRGRRSSRLSCLVGRDTRVLVHGVLLCAIRQSHACGVHGHVHHLSPELAPPAPLRQHQKHSAMFAGLPV